MTISREKRSKPDANSIKTDRLLLRDLHDADWVSVHEYSSDPKVCEFMDWGPNSARETKEFIKRAMRAAKDKPRFAYDFAITWQDADRVIGAVSLVLVGFPPNQAMIGYVLGRQHWGQGIMSEAVGAVIGFGFETLKLHRISASCDPKNMASFRVMEKCGMRREGYFVEDKYIKGRWRDTLAYSILAREWNDRQSGRQAK
ncbi:MAG: GNAT family N-acetyltransferase [Candidatus Melainabacteria bacterium]|nr:MAG: GNAT family N-acetyltransferase [Candidatus Melainabacteria bacterium]